MSIGLLSDVEKKDIFFSEAAWHEHWQRSFEHWHKLQLCNRCLYNEDVPDITFDEQGVCNYCKLHDELDGEYPTGTWGKSHVDEIVEKIKKAGRNREFDVIVGVSGGCDSSFMVRDAVKMGLRPLAVHFDNTWNSEIATRNIHRVLDKLGVQLFTHVVDNEVYNDIYRSFLRAGVPDIEAPTDIGLAETLYMACSKYGVKYQFEGHSFRTEGVSPLGWLYMDGKYIETVVKHFGNYSEHRLRSYPNMKLGKFVKHMVFDRIRKIRPLYWVEYDKEKVKQELMDEFGWQWYGGHHLENRFTAFYHTYFLPRRFGIDQRPNGFSALIRSGQMTQEEGIELYREPPLCDIEVVELVKKRLELSDEEFLDLMMAPKRTFRDFKTYKHIFERMRPFFYCMVKMDLVPKSFYMKYTSKTNI